MFDVKGKVVLITGGAAGIGASTVRALLDEGIKHVTILDISEDAGIAFQEVLNKKHGRKAKFIKCDISQEDQLLNAFKTVTNEQGCIDVVINNAAIFNDKTYAKQIDINLVIEIFELCGESNITEDTLNILTTVTEEATYLQPTS